MRRCEYIERKAPPKNILEFIKHFSSRSIHKLFFDHPLYKISIFIFFFNVFMIYLLNLVKFTVCNIRGRICNRDTFDRTFGIIPIILTVLQQIMHHLHHCKDFALYTLQEIFLANNYYYFKKDNISCANSQYFDSVIACHIVLFKLSTEALVNA